MKVGGKKHYDIMEAFEALKPGRTDRESKREWERGRIYQDGKVNELFLMYRYGFAHGEAVAREEQA